MTFQQEQSKYFQQICTIHNEICKSQTLPDGNPCTICGDSEHPAFECPHNAFMILFFQVLRQITHPIHCIWCGKILSSYAKKENLETALSKAKAHSEKCVHNPLVGRILDLRVEIRDLKRSLEE